jgi:hypothetical protein
MTATYYLTLTDHGAQRVAAAHGQAAIVLVNLVLGDAGGQPYDPVSKKNRTTLVNQRAVVPVQSVSHLNDIARVVATIDSSIGGFNIHEIGLTDASGQLVYIGNYHGGYKPILAQGASGELVILIDIKADAGSQILIQISPNIVTANKQWVLDNFVLLSTFNAHVAQNQLEHNNLAALIAAEAQARGNADNAEAATRVAAIQSEANTRSQADNELEADTYALSVATENALQQERNVRAADISTVATRVEDLSVFKHVRLLYRDMSTSTTPRPPNADENYTVSSVSAQFFPDSYVRQTIRLITNARDTWLPVYLPIGCDVILSASGMVQSGGSGTGDDDIALRIKSFFGQGQESFMNYRSTFVEIRVDRVSDDQTTPYTGDVTVYLEFATLTYLKPTSLNNYPVISP